MSSDSTPIPPHLEMRPIHSGDEHALLEFYQAFSAQDAFFFTPWPITLQAMASHIVCVEKEQALGLVVVDNAGQVHGHAFIKNVRPLKLAEALQIQHGASGHSFDRFRQRCLQICSTMVRKALRRPAPPRFGIGLRRELQGQGWGRKLTAAILETARQRQVPRITLGVHKANEKAVRLYQKLGFSIVGDLSQQSPADSYEMDYRRGRSS